MNASRWCHFEELEQAVTRQFRCGPHSDHGPAHWRRVEQNGIRLCTRTAGDILVVRLFAWLHDSKRENEFTDPDHGRRGAAHARSLRGRYFGLEDAAFEKLVYACTWHTDHEFSDDPTIGTCWDADRLDLGRVGIVPSAKYMSTEFAREVARVGSFQPFLSDDSK